MGVEASCGHEGRRELVRGQLLIFFIDSPLQGSRPATQLLRVFDTGIRDQNEQVYNGFGVLPNGAYVPAGFNISHCHLAISRIKIGHCPFKRGRVNGRFLHQLRAITGQTGASLLRRQRAQTFTQGSEHPNPEFVRIGRHDTGLGSGNKFLETVVPEARPDGKVCVLSEGGKYLAVPLLSPLMQLEAQLARRVPDRTDTDHPSADRRSPISGISAFKALERDPTSRQNHCHYDCPRRAPDSSSNGRVPSGYVTRIRSRHLAPIGIAEFGGIFA